MSARRESLQDICDHQYLEETELVGCLVWTNDHGFHIANVDIAAGDRKSYQSIMLAIN